MRLPQPFVQILLAIASLVAVPFAHATSGDSTPFLLDTRNYQDSTPLFSVDTRAPDLIANTGITDSGGDSFTITMAMLKVTGGGTITFTLVTGPVHGTLFLNGISQGAGAMFTQAQIDAGFLSYQRVAGDRLTDTFEVAAMDDDAGLLGGNLSFAVAGIPAASGSLFLVDTRNYTDSTGHTVHTDKRAYLTADTVPGSLRQAIANAAAGETVDFDAGLSGGTITLGGSQLTLDKSLSVDASALSDGITISGNDASRIFLISGVSEVSLSNLTMTEGSEYLGGAVYADTVSSLTMQSCTLVGNRATAGGGALFSYRPTAVIDLVNCTVSGNEADSAGGLYTNGATIRLKHSTVANNTATISAGGIRISGGAIEIENSIVAGNSAPMAADILSDTGSGPISGTGTNLIGSNESVETAFPEGLLVGTPANPIDPLLAPLGDYGGSTQTIALRAGSPAINAAGASALLTDQRSFTRVGAPDIGAYESGNAAGYGVWATEMISEGLDASFSGNADEDPTANGAEYALGTGVLISDPASPNNPEVITNGAGEIEITFGFNPIAAVDTRWIIERTTDLENYTEIYRYDGPTATSTPVAGVSALVGATSITVTDPNPPSPNVYYRFGAQTAP